MITLRGVLGRLLLLGFALLASLAIAETLFSLLLSHPAWLARLPANVLSHLRAYYLQNDRTLIQALPECAQYDPALFYTLRPGVCRFEAREFAVEVRVNSSGLRDDEESLKAPDVIVAGDSFAMGWGVAQDEAFPQAIERRTGLKALNAGIPSYGTVREMRLLDRLDTSRLRYLLIQYDDNDKVENDEFFRGNVLAIRPAASYRGDVQHQGKRNRYFPGKITFGILAGIFEPEPPPRDSGFSPKDEARYFVNAILHATRADLSNVQVVVFELQPYGVSQSDFAMALLKEIALPGHRPYIRRMRVLDLRARIKPEDYFILDDHLRPSGHARVAELVVEEMRKP